MTKRLRICIDARLPEGEAGGVQQFVLGLASGLSALTDGDEEYFFLMNKKSLWLKPYIGGPCKTIYIDGLLNRARKIFNRRKKRQMLSNGTSVRISDGTIENARINIMHFTIQSAFLTDIPTIYHPHDLQHIHFPEFFPEHLLRVRDASYRVFCERAQMVAVSSSWVKRDVIRNFGLPSENIHVIPLAPATAAYPEPTIAELEATRRKFDLPEKFIFYPAQTWEHKNHIGLIKAIGYLRNQGGDEVTLVSSGRRNDFAVQIDEQVERIGISDQVRFLGFVSPGELQCIYRLCHCVVIPTKFEAASAPLWEAFLAQRPAACSNVTSLPEQAGDAALVFDPDKTDEIADAVYRLWTDDDLRSRLVEKGNERVKLFNWNRTARMFRAHYRRLGGRLLTEEDNALISRPPLM